MSFIVRILFTGLMTFVPNQDGTEVTVLLLKVPHQHQLTDSSTLPEHKPLIIARAGTCTGDCPTDTAAIADFLYDDLSQSAALDSLEEAASGGGAWLLDGADLSVEKGDASDPALPSLTIRTGVRGTDNGQPKIIPTTSTEREDFTWLAKASDILGSSFTIDSAALAANPTSDLVAARFRIRNGTVFTYSVAKIGSNVTPVHFEQLDGEGDPSSYSQAVAGWMAVDIEVSGDSIDIVEEPFDSGSGRTMQLTPDANDRVEIAVLNIPPFVPPASPASSTDVGKHFEMYYDLADNPPGPENRFVPKPGAAPGSQSYSSVNWQSIHPNEQLFSELLNQLRMNIGRSMYEQVLCPPDRP